MAAYYNEIDPFAAAWLRELIKRNLIAPGDVDERSIEDVRPDDLRGYTQCHFFAGIGGWSYALRLAGWPDDHPVWTGSCPCQPFSTAGKRKGTADERHLWPAFFHLIHECRPVTVFGEQVASKDGLAWLDLVQADMEGAGYAIGAVDTCAAGFGAPHIRQRLYWVAHTGYGEYQRWDSVGCAASTDDGAAQAMCGKEDERKWPCDDIADGCSGNGLAHSPEFRYGGYPEGTQVQGQCAEREGQHPQPGYAGELSGGFEGCCGVGNTQGNRRENESPFHGSAGSCNESGCGWGRAGRPGAAAGRMGNNNNTGLERLSGNVGATTGRQEPIGQAANAGDDADATMPTNGFWRGPDWLWCRDKKWRPVKSGLSPLADGLPRELVSCSFRCASCGTELILGRELSVLWKVYGRNEGSANAEVLLSRVLSFIQAKRSTDQQKYRTLQGEALFERVLRNMRGDCGLTDSSHRPKSFEQCNGESSDCVPQMPFTNTQRPGTTEYLRSLWEAVQSEVAQEARETLFCPVCADLRTHVCRKEMARVKDFRAISQRLKGYGNAIVAPQAAEIIKVFMEVCGA